MARALGPCNDTGAPQAEAVSRERKSVRRKMTYVQGEVAGLDGSFLQHRRTQQYTSSKMFLSCIRNTCCNLKHFKLLYLLPVVIFLTSLHTEARTEGGSSFQRQLSGLLNSDSRAARGRRTATSPRILQDYRRRRRRSIADNAAGSDLETAGSNHSGLSEFGYDDLENGTSYLDIYEIIENLYAGPVCTFIDVRNSPEDLKDLENCTVVNGFVHIVFMHNAKESDFDKYTFPKLRVITEYLLLYRVYGLRSLRKMFPNLAVIGGRKIFDKYAMVIFENPQLQELGLGNLRHIGRGGVRIQKNSKLCYLDTVDWRRLGMLGDNIVNGAVSSPVISDNLHSDETCLDQCGDESECPRSEADKLQHCWGLHLCQKPSCPKECPNACMNGKCVCHKECLSGCTAPNNASACLACRNKSFNSTCVAKCPVDTYLKNDWRCVTREWCELTLNWIIHDGQCIQNCPRDHIEKNDDYTYYCEYCGKDCHKACGDVFGEYVVDDLTEFKGFRRCSKFHGRLVISLSRGGEEFVKKTEEVLQGLEEVGALVIKRSESLVSLSILKNLKRITGRPEALKDGTYSLYVLENPNLRELFPASNSTELSAEKAGDVNDLASRLRIDGGKAFFHFNPRLCMKEIEKVSALTKEVEDDKDISEITNGDRATCDMLPLKIEAIKHMPIGDDNYATVRIIWQTVKITDPRTLIGYQVFYKESKTMNATRFEGVYACGKTSAWTIKDKLVDPHKYESGNGSNTSDTVLHDLKPFTQYAVYVRTYTTSTAKKGAQSDIMYFRTKPSRPTGPMSLITRAVNTTSIFVQWKEPMFPNGLISHYVVRWRRQKEHLEVIRSVDLCKPDLQEYPSAPPETKDDGTETDPRESSPPKIGGGKDCCSCDGSPILPKHEEEANNNLNFENYLHNYILRVQFYPSVMGDVNSRRKRSLYEDDSALLRHSRDASIFNFSGNSTEMTIDSNTTANGTGFEFSTELPTTAIEVTSSAPVDDEFQWHIATTISSNITLENLHHFSEYEIQVYACNNASGLPISDDLNPLDCSIESIASRRTRNLPSADVIPAGSLKFGEVDLIHNNARRRHKALKWAPPSDPNAYVKVYTVELQRKEEGGFRKVSETCYSLGNFESYQGYYVLSLQAGQYQARVMPVTPAGKGQWTEFVAFEIEDTEPTTSAQRNVWIAAMGVGIVCIILSFLGIWCYCKRRNEESKNAMIYSSANPEYVSLAANYIPDGYEVDEDDVELLREIGHGNFGKVFVGYAKQVVKGEDKTQVAIKKLHERSSIHKRMEFLEEAKLMKAFNATHVVRLLGVVSQVPDPLVIMEYMEKGDLKSHLRSRRDDAEVEEGKVRVPPPSVHERFQMAAEIADGMAYLSGIKYVHRDLAARNCLVNADGVVKIGDFGLTRDIYEMDYYRKGSRGLLPIRWMAPESLKDGVFDSRSDVWSFGVVLWEIATLAEQPYQGLPHDQVTRFVIDGGFMEKPHGCVDKLYDLMLNCWQFTANMRPTFIEILSLFSDDVNDRFKDQSFYYEYRREHPEEFKVDEETAFMNSLNASLRGTGSRKGTPQNLTPSRSRSDTPHSCHTPTSRNSNGSAKDAEPTTTIANTFHNKIPNGAINGLHQSPRIENGLPRKGSGIIRNASGLSQRGGRITGANHKKTPPETLTRRGEDFYYSLSSSGIGAEMNESEFTESETTDLSSVENENPAGQENHNPWQPRRYSPEGDVAYASLWTTRPEAKRIQKSASMSSNKSSMENDALAHPLATDAEKPYAHMNGFIKRNNSLNKLPSPRRVLSSHSPMVDESSYVDTSPQLNSKYFESGRPNHFRPLRTSIKGPPPSPPASPPPIPPTVRAVSP